MVLIHRRRRSTRRGMPLRPAGNPEQESVHPEPVRSDDSVFVRRGSIEGPGTFLAEVQASPGRCSDSEVSTCWLVKSGTEGPAVDHGRAPRSRDGSSGRSYVHRPAGRIERAALGHPASASGSPTR